MYFNHITFWDPGDTPDYTSVYWEAPHSQMVRGEQRAVSLLWWEMDHESVYSYCLCDGKYIFNQLGDSSFYL